MFKGRTFLLVIIVFSFVGSTAFAGGPALPGFELVAGEPVSPGDAHKFFRYSEGRIQLLGGESGDGADPEIVELARGLRNDPNLMYKFVHDHIEYTPIFGGVKGAYMTLMDRRGNSFDQASLLIALLREAGYTANYVYGVIRLTTAEAKDWLGVSEGSGFIEDLLASAGIPVSSGGGYCDIAHVWVKVNIGGTDYVFDPSIKTHTYTSGIDLQSAMGYNRKDFLDDVLSGATVQSDYIQNINRASLASDLATLSSNLIDYIDNNEPGATLDDIIGGKNIIPATNAPSQTSLPYELSITDEWTDIPNAYRTSLQIECNSIDVTLYSSDIYGRRLTLFYDDSDQPVLALDGEILATGGSATSGTSQNITLSIDHPYAAESGTYCDKSDTVSIKAGGSYLIVNGWAHTGTKIIEKHRRLLKENMYLNDDSQSEPVLGESLALIGFTWLAENSRDEQIVDQMINTTTTNHHTLGICGQYGSPYIDLPMGLTSVTSHNGNSADEIANFFTTSGQGSAFESGVVEQLQSYGAVSTVKLMDISNEQSDRIFEATSSNYYSTIKSQLVNYDSNELASVESYIDSGYRVILPQDGDLGEEDWTGIGFLSISSSEQTLGHIISGDLNGGYGTVEGPLSVPELEVAIIEDPTDLYWDSHTQSNEPIDLVTGGYLYEHSDLSIGSGGYPFRLDFKRSYNSQNALEDDPLGMGWTHNFDISSTVGSDGFQTMGVDSPIDAAAHIVERYVTLDLLAAERTLTNVTVASLAHNWLMDQMIDNIVTISQPGNSMQFVKLPDGSYNPPPSNASTLTLEGDDGYLLRTKHGQYLDFDPNGRIITWSDPNNTITFEYEEYEIEGEYEYINDYRVSHWKLDEGQGDDAYDSVGSNDGELRLGVNWIGDGYSGAALEFDGYKSCVIVGDKSELELQDFTLSYWASLKNPADYLNGGVSKGYTFGGDLSVSYSLNFSEGGAQALIACGGDAYNTDRSKAPIPNTNWHMWTMTAGNGIFRIYRDGTFMDSETYPGVIDYQQYDDIFRMGGNSTYSINGFLDEVIFFGTVLSDDEIKGLYLGQNESSVGYRLKQVSNGFGRSLTFNYNEDDRIGSVTDSANRVVSYGYDEAGNLTTVTDANGFVTTFVYDPNNDGRMTQIYYPANPSNPFVTNIYDSLRRVKEQTDANGHTYQYYYSGYRTEEFDPDGFSKIYRFDDAGLTISEENQLGEQVLYEYDGQQRRTLVTYPGGNSARYCYDENHNVSQIIQMPIPDSNEPNIIESFIYEPNFSRVIVRTDPNGNVTTFSYYDNGKLKDMNQPDVDSLIPQTHFIYNAYGQKEFSIDPEGMITKYKYDAGTGDLLQTIVDYGIAFGASMISHWKLDEAGGETAYDSVGGNDGTVYGAQWSAGKVDGALSFDGIDDYIGIPVVDWPIAGTEDFSIAAWIKPSVLDGDYRMIVAAQTLDHFQFNLSSGGTSYANIQVFLGGVCSTSAGLSWNLGQWYHIAVTRNAGTITFYRDGVDAGGGGTNNGNISPVTTLNVGCRSFTPSFPHPFNGIIDEVMIFEEALSEEQLEAIINNTYSGTEPGLNITTEMTYDAVGNVKTRTDPLGNTTTYEYDPMRRLIKEISPSPFGYLTKYEYDPESNLKTVKRQTSDAGHPWQVTSYTYTPTGKKQTVTDPQGNVTQYEYDSLDRLWKTTDAEGNVTEQLYDPAGRLRRVIDAEGNNSITYTYTENGNVETLTDAKGNTTTYEYDGHDRLKKTIYPDSTYEQLGYDERGNIIEKTLRNGQTIYYSYDELNRLEIKTLPDSQQVQYEYDLVGRLEEITNGGGTIYNNLDRIGRIDNVVYPDGKTVSYQYDNAGNRTMLTYPDDTYITYEYDELNRLTDIYDQNSSAVAHYDYDDLSQRTAAQYANGTFASYSYDYSGKLLNLDNQFNSANRNFAYSYDNVGNRLTMQINGTELHSYAYDNTYQLTNVDYPAGYFAADTTFDYDPAYNRLYVVNGGVTGYAANNLNQYSSVGGTSYSYDDNGNLTYDGENSYSYDAENRLTSADTPEGTATYSYDPMGRRISKHITSPASRFTRYVYDGEQVIAEYDGGGNLLRRFVYGAGIDEPVMMVVINRSADITGAGGVNAADLTDFADAWLSIAAPRYSAFDYNQDGYIGFDDLDWLCQKWLSAGGTDFEDFAGLAKLWLTETGTSPDPDYNADADLYADGRIDFADFAVLAEYWLTSGERSDDYYYYHFDGLGSVIALSDKDGDVVEVYNYDVYGSVDSVSSPGESLRTVANPYYFTGRRYDKETNLYHYRARMYNPAIGRFLQVDPIGYDDSMNLYVYCGNNPVVLIDPYGLCSDDFSWNDFEALFWERVGDIADTALLLKEFSDIIEAEAGIELGLEAEVDIGPARIEIGGSTGDTLKTEGSQTRWVTEASIGASVKIGENWSVGPSASIEQNRSTGEISTSKTPLGISRSYNDSSSASAVPMKASVGATLLFLHGKVGVNFSEMKDLYDKMRR